MWWQERQRNQRSCVFVKVSYKHRSQAKMEGLNHILRRAKGLRPRRSRGHVVHSLEQWFERQTVEAYKNP